MKNKELYTNRERKLLQNKRRWIKHGEGKWSPIIGISKQRKKQIEDKIKGK